MSLLKSILIIFAWGILTIINFYFVPYFLLALEWLLILFIFLLFAIIKTVKISKSDENLTKSKKIQYGLITVLFFLTIYPHPVNKVLEKIDWFIFYSKRIEIVQMVKNRQLNPNVSWSKDLCELPYEFPVISNGGNDIVINRIDSSDHLTVTFWIFRNFFSSPSTHLIYTNNPYEIERIQHIMNRDPSNNWEIEKNWYRTFED